jgi:hypothetical protein
MALWAICLQLVIGDAPFENGHTVPFRNYDLAQRRITVTYRERKTWKTGDRIREDRFLVRVTF